MFALVAQWIERLVAVQKVAGPIPAERTREEHANCLACVRNRTPERCFASLRNREAVPRRTFATAKVQSREIPAERTAKKKEKKMRP